MDIADQLQMLEEKMLQPSLRRDSHELAELLADNFVEFGSSGRIFDKSAILRELHDETPAQLTLRNFETLTLAKNVIQVTYISTRITDRTIVESLRSSIWVLQDGSWKIRFHQGTRLVTQDR